MRRLAEWVHSLGGHNLPVLQRSVRAMADLREREDSVTARDIAALVLRDPFLTVKVLRFSQARLTRRQPTEVTTVEHALMMHGVASFFRQFRDLVSLEDSLDSHPGALEGALAVGSRAHHAAVNARNFSALRHDVESEEVLISALLHDLAEMLLWCTAPELAIQIQWMLRSTPGMRSASAQKVVLGFALSELQLALARQWRLPALLLDLMDDSQAGKPRVQIVRLSVSLARHSANGWHDPALPDDYGGLQKLVSLPPDQVKRWVRQSALQAARHWRDFGVRPAAAWLPMGRGNWPVVQSQAKARDGKGRGALVGRCLEQLGSATATTAEPAAVIAVAFHALHEGLGLQRLWYGGVNRAGDRVDALVTLGLDGGRTLGDLGFDLGSRHLFARLMERAQGVWYSAANRDRLMALLPETARDEIAGREFFAMSMHVNSAPSGLIYADAGDERGVLDESRYNAFKQICTAAAQALERLTA
jgi:HD-like signal output (HDOD) protein